MYEYASRIVEHIIHPAHPSSDSRVCTERPRTVGMAPSVWAIFKISTIHDSRLPTPWYGKSGCIYNHFGFLTTQRGDQSRGPRRRRTRAREGEDDARYGRGRPEGRETSSRRAESRVESSRRAESLAREDEKETNLDVDSETHPVVDKGS